MRILFAKERMSYVMHGQLIGSSTPLERWCAEEGQRTRGKRCALCLLAPLACASEARGVPVCLLSTQTEPPCPSLPQHLGMQISEVILI